MMQPTPVTTQAVDLMKWGKTRTVDNKFTMHETEKL